MRKKKNEINDIDTAFELGAFAIQNWWKLVTIIAVAGLAVTGFSLKCGNNEIKKDQINIRSAVQSGVKNE